MRGLCNRCAVRGMKTHQSFTLFTIVMARRILSLQNYYKSRMGIQSSILKKALTNRGPTEGEEVLLAGRTQTALRRTAIGTTSIGSPIFLLIGSLWALKKSMRTKLSESTTATAIGHKATHDVRNIGGVNPTNGPVSLCMTRGLFLLKFQGKYGFSGTFPGDPPEGPPWQDKMWKREWVLITYPAWSVDSCA